MSQPTGEVIQVADPTETTNRKQARAPSPEDTDDESHVEEFCGTSIHASLSTLLFSDKFADMTIKCKEREFSAHRAIVCSQSSFFDKALSSNFKEAMTQTVELQEDDPDIVERFLEFLYTGNYTDSVIPTLDKPSAEAMMDPTTVRQNLREPAYDYEVPTSDNALFDEPDEEWQPPAEEADEPEEEYREDPIDEESSADGNGHGDQEDDAKVMTMKDIALAPKEEGLKLLARLRNDMTLPLRLYAMADVYDVPALRLLARDRFYRAAELYWEEAECFPDIVDELYETTPPGDTAMREIVCRLVGARILDHEVREKMRHVMTKHGEFAVSVLEYAIRSRTFAQ
ncbi:hypothetical protein NXS19_009477 [Fusarium pseudograminearum]|nr:hypothetical protein NXS19_009477 [Fusarium pseudograminearum]